MKKILKGNGFILRHATLADAPGYYEFQLDKEAKKNFMRTPKNLVDAKKDLRKDIKNMNKKNPDRELFTLEINNEVAGFIWIDEITYSFLKHRASIGFFINKKFRGKGIGSKATKLVTDYAFKKYKLKRMYTYTRDFNIGSRKALEKAGYKLEGILIKNKCKNGKYLNDCIYARVK